MFKAPCMAGRTRFDLPLFSGRGCWGGDQAKGWTVLGMHLGERAPRFKLMFPSAPLRKVDALQVGAFPLESCNEGDALQVGAFALESCSEGHARAPSLYPCWPSPSLLCLRWWWPSSFPLALSVIVKPRQLWPSSFPLPRLDSGEPLNVGSRSDPPHNQQNPSRFRGALRGLDRRVRGGRAGSTFVPRGVSTSQQAY